MAHLPKGQGVFLPPFQAWLANNIPAVYDNTLSYYEELCALIKYLQDIVVPAVNENASAVTTISEAVEQLQKYVEDYFKNLDVQEEINNKLDEMAEDGTLAEIVGEYLGTKLNYYLVDNTWTQSDIQEKFDVEDAKVIEFKSQTYNFTSPFRLNSNTKILLNNAVLNSADPHLFFNFKDTDTSVTGYNGHHNIQIIGGTINGGISFIHGKNIIFKDINFYHVENDHCMELCACKDVQVDGCEFEGVVAQTNDRQFVENVQIENATHENFPWLTSDSDTYDNIGCENIEVKNCNFKQTDIITYRFYAGVGGHTYVDDYPHTNIKITNNTFTDSISFCIRLHNTVNTVIENNVMKQSNVVNPDGNDVNAINIYNGAKNLKICKNIIDGFCGSQMYLAYGTEDCVISNNIFKNCPKVSVADSSESSNVLFFRGVNNLYVTNNEFLDNASCICYQYPDTNNKGNLFVFTDNKIINSSTITDQQYYLNRIYNTSKVIFERNTFNIYGSNVGHLLRLHERVDHVIYKGNMRTDKVGGDIDANGYTGSYADVYGVYVSGWYGNTASITNQTSNTPYTQYNKCRIVLGDAGSKIGNVIIQPHQVVGKFLAGTTCASAISDGTTVGTVKITFNNDENHTITASSSVSGFNLRFINFFNE